MFRVPPSWAVLAALSLWSAEAVAGPARERRVVLSELRAGEVPRVRVRRGESTVLLFDAPVAGRGVKVEERGRFERVDVAERSVVVRLEVELEPGERLLLEVPFADGKAPARAVFALVSEPGEVDGQVEVVRHARTAEQLQAELDALRARCEPERRPDWFQLAGLLGREKLVSDLFEGRFHGTGLSMQQPWLLRTLHWQVLFFSVRNPRDAAPVEPGEALLWESGRGTKARPVPLLMDRSRLEPGEEGLLGVKLEGLPASAVWRLEIGEKGGNRRLHLGGGGSHGR
ncbi:MAG TPA: DUF2381 family protein [Myxococcaceae bacterium]|nr:DUF2381 family protein [Myxococcaceae bacterium]